MSNNQPPEFLRPALEKITQQLKDTVESNSDMLESLKLKHGENVAAAASVMHMLYRRQASGLHLFAQLAENPIHIMALQRVELQMAEGYNDACAVMLGIAMEGKPTEDVESVAMFIKQMNERATNALVNASKQVQDVLKARRQQEEGGE